MQGLGRLSGRDATILALGLFTALVTATLLSRLPYEPGVLWAIRRHATPQLTAVARAVTSFGSAWVMLPLGSLIAWALARSGRCRYSASLVSATAGGFVLNLVLKDLFRHPRPSGLQSLAPAGGFSFPSGHSMVAMSFYGFLAFLVVRGTWPLPAKVLAVGFLALLILAVGASRLYLGVHFGADVGGGLLVGAAWLTACILLAESP